MEFTTLMEYKVFLKAYGDKELMDYFRVMEKR